MANSLAFLQLLQLADSALPVGAAAHSYGLETLVAEKMLTVPTLPLFLQDYFQETGMLEWVYCRAALKLVGNFQIEEWQELNRSLGALKPARESREAANSLGRRFIKLAIDLLPENEILAKVNGELYYATAFGQVAGLLGLDEESAGLALLQQNLTGLISACQRLLPLGQALASQINWRLKPVLLEIMERGRELEPGSAALVCFTPLVEIASFRHPGLPTRLFIS